MDADLCWVVHGQSFASLVQFSLLLEDDDTPLVMLTSGTEVSGVSSVDSADLRSLGSPYRPEIGEPCGPPGRIRADYHAV